MGVHRILMVVHVCQRLKANAVLNEKREIMEQLFINQYTLR